MVTGGELAVLVVVVPVVLAAAGVMWRAVMSIRDNTATVARLAVVVEGAASTVGLADRVRHLEDWRTAVDAVRHAGAFHGQAGP